MQAATAHSLTAPRRRAGGKTALPTFAEARLNGEFIDALPIAAGVFTLRDGRLWVEVVNSKFHDLAECGDAADFADKFRQYASGDGGDFIRDFLTDPANAPDERELVDGDGAIRRAFTAQAGAARRRVRRPAALPA